MFTVHKGAQVRHSLQPVAVSECISIGVIKKLGQLLVWHSLQLCGFYVYRLALSQQTLQWAFQLHAEMRGFCLQVTQIWIFHIRYVKKQDQISSYQIRSGPLASVSPTCDSCVMSGYVTTVWAVRLDFVCLCIYLSIYLFIDYGCKWATLL